jgi:SAM-dependent methyltransferase
MSREHWERHATNWAAWARRPEDEYWQYGRTFFELAPPPRGRTLEVGCGEGRVTRDLAKRGHDVVAVDAASTLIKLAREADSKNHYLRCDAARLPFATSSFDLAVFYNSLMDVDDMEGAVREAARVLRPGGTMCACVTHPIQDAGRFQSLEADAPFVITGDYLGPRRWFEGPAEHDGVTMQFAGWAYPLSGYFGALERAGFAIEAVREPQHPVDPHWRRIPLYLMWRAVKTA